MQARRSLLLFGLVFASACGTPATEADAGVDAGPLDAGTDAPRADAGAIEITIGPTDRPARVILPTAHDGVTPLPLAVLLHGYSASAQLQDVYLGASRTARLGGFYLVLPNGTPDAMGNRFWNATPACCDFGPTGVDDVAYLTGLLDEAEARLPVDATRVYFFGHSNGGFMSYRMACEIPDRVAAIASLAGGDFWLDTDCVPAVPVSVLQIHGTADARIPYAGLTGAYPAAQATVERWAGRAGCDPTMPTAGPALDLDTSLAGAETTVLEWRTGCGAGLDAALWSIEGGSHLPAVARDFTPRLTAWLLAHQR